MDQTPALLAALHLISRLHRATRDGRDDPEARVAIHAAMTRLGKAERETAEVIAAGFCSSPGWYHVIQPEVSMPDPQMALKPFNQVQFIKNLLAVLIAAGKIARPIIGFTPEGASPAPVSAETPEQVARLVDEAIDQRGQAPPEGAAAGPITNALLERAVGSIFNLMASYEDEAVALLIKLADKFEGVLPIPLP